MISIKDNVELGHRRWKYTVDFSSSKKKKEKKMVS